MKDNEALIKTVVTVITVIATAFLGAMIGAFLGAIRGPAFILSQLGEEGGGSHTETEKTDTQDRI